MTTNYAGTNPGSFPATIRIVVDGDPQAAASYAVGMQDLRGTDIFLHGRVTSVAGYVTAIQQQVPGLDVGEDDIPLRGGFVITAGEWAEGALNHRPYWTQVDVDTHAGVTWSISDLLPRTGVIRGVIARVDGGAGHGALPSGLPVLQIRRIAKAILTASSTVIAQQVDESVDVAAYEVSHTIECYPATPEVIDLATYDYLVNLTGEYDSGAEAHTNYTVYGLTLLTGTAP